MGISSLQKNFVLVIECMPLTINDRACNYFTCKRTTNTCPLSTTVLLAHIAFALRIYAHLFLITLVLLLSQLLPFENAIVNKHAARHWLSTFLFASKVPLWTSDMHRHCWFVKEVPLCVCLTVSTRRPSNNIILRKKWDFTWQNCKQRCLSETYEEYVTIFASNSIEFDCYCSSNFNFVFL